MSDTFDIQRPFVAEQKLLRERLQIFLHMLHPLLQADVSQALMSPGKLLSTPSAQTNSPELPSGMWSLLSLLVAKSLAGETSRSYMYSVAVATECFICALDLLDDIEDADQTSIVLELGPARVLNVSTTLLALTNHIILSLLQKTEYPAELIVRLLASFQETLLAATAGQHRDIMAEQRTAESFSTEECIEIAEGKAGSLMRFACSIGALSVNADTKVVTQFAELGRLLGIAHQLDNDSHDLYYILQHEQENASIASEKTDLVRQKKTLPVVLAAHMMPPPQLTAISDKDRQSLYVNALHEGIMTTWGISLLYRERAREQLEQIEMQHPLPHNLHLLLGFA